MPVLLTVLAALVLAPAAHAAWRAPVDGPVVGAFTYDAREPFAAGARRGVDLAADRGAPVSAACAGTVTFAGRTPRGRAVTVRCGRRLATHLGLATVRVRRGIPVGAGALLGEAAGTVRLSAREGGRYVDPEPLLAATPPALGPAPTTRTPRSRPRTPGPLASPPNQAAPAHRALVPNAAPPAATTTPPLAWAGLALLALGAGGGGLATARRRAARRAGTASATG